MKKQIKKSIRVTGAIMFLICIVALFVAVFMIPPKITTAPIVNQPTFNPATATRAQWREKIATIDDIDKQFTCTDMIEDEYAGVQVQQVSDTGWIVLFSCRPFAYQIGIFAYYFDTTTQELKQATRPGSEFLGEAPRQTVFSNDFTGFATLNPNGVVQLYEKYAGHNGCGESGEYQWNNETLQFDIVKLRQHEDCNNPLEPEQWPLIDLHKQ